MYPVAQKIASIKYPSNYISQRVTKLHLLVQQLSCPPAAPPPSPFSRLKKN